MELYEGVKRLMEEGSSTADAAETALDRFIAAHGKIIPGFGHRFHPVDPRVAPLLSLVEAATASGHVGGTFAAIGIEVERALLRRTGKSIPMNIDGVTAVIFSELGFPAPLGRGLFILSRSVGILAHAWEQHEQGHRMKGPMPKEIPYTYAGPARRSLGPRPPRK
jgi:citrate synthase